MKSDLPKVLFEVRGRPLIAYVLDALEAAGVRRIVVVVGYQSEKARRALANRPELVFVEQTEQLGTGHAVMVCRHHLEEHQGPVVVLAGDSPLTQADSLARLLAEYGDGRPACVLGTLHKQDPAGLGRIVRGADGSFLGIVEQKDATEQQRKITEVNMSTYVFDGPELLNALQQIDNRNRQGEYYVTDCPGVLKRQGKDVRALAVLKPCEALSVNTISELELVEAAMREMGYEMRELKIFSGQANRQLAEDICGFLNIPVGEISLGKFPDGENYCKVEEDVRGRDVFLLQPTCPPVNDNLMELLIMIDSCKRASAARVTAVIPYYGYARQDRKDEGRVPITAKLVANLIARAGADRVLTMDLHAAQIQGFFDVPVDHLYAAPVFNEHFMAMGWTADDVVVVSPDEGSIKRAVGHVKRLGGRLAIVDKRRASAMKTMAENLIGGPIEGQVAVMFDDMISTAGSICAASKLVHAAGAREIHVAATHGLFCGSAIDNLQAAPITSILVSDSIPLTAAQKIPKIKILSVAPLLAEALKRIHHDQSISALFRERRR